MTSERGLILWIAGFSGAFLIYSAYKGHSPLTVLTSYFTTGSGITGVVPGNVLPTNGSGIPNASASASDGPKGQETYTVHGTVA